MTTLHCIEVEAALLWTATKAGSDCCANFCYRYASIICLDTDRRKSMVKIRIAITLTIDRIRITPVGGLCRIGNVLRFDVRENQKRGDQREKPRSA